MTTSSKRLRLVALVIGLGASIGLLASRDRAPASSHVDQAPSAPFASGAWPAGATRTYQARFRSKSALTLQGLGGESASKLAGTIDLEGDLVLRSHGTEEKRLVLAIEWAALRQATLDTFDRPLTTAAVDELRAARAVVRLDPDGHLVSIGFVENATPLARHVQRAIVTELAAVAEGVWGSQPLVDTSLGRAQVQRVRGASFTRTSYAELDAIGAPSESHVEGSGTGALGEHGSLQRLLHDERVSAEPPAESPIDALSAETHLELTFTKIEHEAPAAATDTKPEPVRPAQPSDQSRTASLERRASGVTAETVFADLRMAALLPRAQETKWTWHDSAWLELHPEAAEPLLRRAEAELPLTGIAAAYDVLVISGTPAAQAALVGSLERVRGKADHTFEILVQHIAHLRAPKPEVFAAIALEYGRSRENLDRRRACGYTLGALVRRSIEARSPVMPAGDRPKCEGTDCAPEEVLAALERDLARETDERQRVMLLRALGNAGQTSSFRAVAPHAKSADAETRRAVADALRNMESGEVVDLLLALASDSDGDVASIAFQSLFRKALDASDWDAIEQLVRSDRVPGDAHFALVSGLAARRLEMPRASAVLLVLMTNERTSPRVKMQIENILRSS
jgi:hypothetical protein